MFDKIDQVIAQCECVAHMSKTLADVYLYKAQMFRERRHVSGGIEDFVGNHSAHLMETLGDILNGIDAVDSNDDKWVTVFEKAQEMFPQSDMEIVPWEQNTTAK